MPDYFFDYELPERLIAQHPAARRDDSRLLVANRSTGTFQHKHFRDLPELLNPGDRLVLNDTKVLPARLVGTRARTGGKWEGLFLKEREGLWELMAKTRGYPELGETIAVEPSGLKLILRGRTEDRHWLVQPDPPGTPAELLTEFGHIPLPPYIRDSKDGPGDRERYQTVYAERSGSVAAPTAGLHFTPEVLNALKTKGIGTTRITLHVGLGTFAPVKAVDPTQHKLHAEWGEVSETAVKEIQNTAGRVIAVGTTSTRTLEAAAKGDKGLSPFRGETALFIHPPFEFNVLDGLITNFHLPRTTLLLLVGAFAGTELLKAAYNEAIREEYRFYSYGDAMLIL